MARPTFSSALKVRSRTAPVPRPRSLVRTAAWPTARRPGPDGLYPRLLGGSDHAVDRSQHFRRLAEGNGPGHVGVIPVRKRAEVELDNVTTAEVPVGWTVMGLRRVGAEGDDGFEGDTFRPALAHGPLQLEGHLFLGDPLHELGNDAFE